MYIPRGLHILWKRLTLARCIRILTFLSYRSALLWMVLICRVLNEVSRNLSGYLHVPGPLLKDIGFLAFNELNNKFLERLGYFLLFPLH